MTGWYAERTPGRPARAVIAVTLLALLLVAAMPVALLAGVVMMMLGHLAGGLALSGGSILAAAIAVALAGMSGMRHLRKLLSGGSFRVVQAGRQPGHRRCRASGQRLPQRRAARPQPVHRSSLTGPSPWPRASRAGHPAVNSANTSAVNGRRVVAEHCCCTDPCTSSLNINCVSFTRINDLNLTAL